MPEKLPQQTTLIKEEELNFALEAAQIGAWDLDLLTHTAHRTLKHDQIFGYESLLPEWTYEMFLEHVHPEDREFVDKKFKDSLAKAEDWYFECRIFRVDKSLHWIWARGKHFKDEYGKPVRIIGLVGDITEQKKHEQELKELYEKLKEKNEELETINQIMMGREEKILELKTELRELKETQTDSRL